MGFGVEGFCFMAQSFTVQGAGQRLEGSVLMFMM